MVADVRADGPIIRRKREECGHGLTDFARLVGLSPSYLSRVERDLANPSPDVLRRIALALRREAHAKEAIAEIARTDGESNE
jgi:transcriptional regulator with XRE-family HTH domain